MSNVRDSIGEIHNYGIDVKNREIYLHSAKDNGEDDPGVDYRMAINFVKNIRHLDSISNHEIRTLSWKRDLKWSFKIQKFIKIILVVPELMN